MHYVFLLRSYTYLMMAGCIIDQEWLYKQRLLLDVDKLKWLNSCDFTQANLTKANTYVSFLQFMFCWWFYDTFGLWSGL